jgi:ABC-type phosphate transport system substrate-binding protein
MRRRLQTTLAAAAFASCVGAPRPIGAADVVVKVIAHPTRAGTLSEADARAIYLKQRLLWSDGAPIVAVNREAGSEAREAFSERIFGQSSRRLAAYWNQRYFEAGEFPPATLASEEAVIRFVAGNANAIGYVVATEPEASVAVVLELFP